MVFVVYRFARVAHSTVEDPVRQKGDGILSNPIELPTIIAKSLDDCGASRARPSSIQPHEPLSTQWRLVLIEVTLAVLTRTAHGDLTPPWSANHRHGLRPNRRILDVAIWRHDEAHDGM